MNQPNDTCDPGPWTPGVTNDGRHYVESSFFKHDARLYLDGDFASEDDKMEYVTDLANKLNLVHVVNTDVRFAGFTVVGGTTIHSNEIFALREGLGKEKVRRVYIGKEPEINHL